jgi:hypothetical protein
MKKYKLIKKYPGSTEVGEIVQGNGREGWYTKGPGCRTYDWTQVVYYPEYWEEVIERDFEVTLARRAPYKIISVKRLSDGEVFSIGDKFIANISSRDVIRTIQTLKVEGSILTLHHENGELTNTKGSGIFHTIKKLEQLDYEIISYFKKDRPACVTTKKRGGEKHEEFWNIHSVKRLSDGEVFTVGDIVSVKLGSSNKRLDKIKLNDDSSAFLNGIWFYYSSGSSHFRNVTKEKQPIFLTHDGKDIFEGDTVWYVNKKTFAYHYVTAYPDGGFHSSINAYFLTKAAAENYLIQKSHSLSIEDFWEFVSWGGSTIAKSKRLKRLVKERLN